LPGEELDGRSNLEVDGEGIFDQEYEQNHQYQANIFMGSELGPPKSTTKPSSRTKFCCRIAKLLQVSGICKYKKGRKLKDVGL
jgi:hypothetical protein